MSKYAHLLCIITQIRLKFKTHKIQHVHYSHLCLITEKSQQNTSIKLTEVNYSAEFRKVVVCPITLSYPHIPHSIPKPSILPCKTHENLTTIVQKGTRCESLQPSILKVSPLLPGLTKAHPCFHSSCAEHRTQLLFQTGTVQSPQAFWFVPAIHPPVSQRHAPFSSCCCMHWLNTYFPQCKYPVQSSIIKVFKEEAESPGQRR